MRILVIDVETTVRCHTGQFVASPFFKDNRIVALGYTYIDTKNSGHSGFILSKYYTEDDDPDINLVLKPSTNMIVGHNLGFDLHYIRKHIPNWYELTKDMIFWDTAIAEFILSRQTKKFPSLNDCLDIRGLPLKVDGIAEMWQAGVQTEDIDKDVLIDYLKQDVSSTAKIFQRQFTELKHRNMLNYALAEMESFKATNEMEWNGMIVDSEKLEEYQKALWISKETLERNLVCFVPKEMRGIYNPSKDALNHTVIFGGIYKRTYVETMIDSSGNEILYKSGPKKGNTRSQKKTENVPFEGLLKYRPESLNQLPKLKNGNFSLDEKNLHAIFDILNPYPNNANSLDFISSLLSYRKVNKILTTYVRNIFKHRYDDNFIHPSLNHVVAVTGRLSCSNPNLQNQANV